LARKWTREHEAARRRILEMLHREARPFEDMSDGAKAARRALPPLLWAKCYMPHYFRCPFAPLHHRIEDGTNEPGLPTFVGAGRGLGKSVLKSLADPVRRTVDGDRKYFLFGSVVQGLAVDLMDFARVELEQNPRIRCDYGEIRVDGSEEDFTVEIPGRKQTTRWEGFGIGMSPRGRRHGAWRPDAFVGDDLEDAVLARSTRREQQLWDWLMDDVVPAMEPEVWTFTVLGTMYGPGCLLERARAEADKTDAQGRPLVRFIREPSVDAAGRSRWPERFGDAALDRIRSMIGLKNWNRNYALVADDPTKPFQAAWVVFYDHVDRAHLYIVIALDPSHSASERSCPRGLVAIGASIEDGARYVLDATLDHATPLEIVARLFGWNGRWQPQRIVIESNGGYALFQPLILQEQQKRGTWLPVTFQNHKLAKEIRIESLSPAWQQGLWRFPRIQPPGVKALLDEFLSYPDGFRDGPDACALAEEMLPRPAGATEPVHYESLGQRADLRYV